MPTDQAAPGSGRKIATRCYHSPQRSAGMMDIILYSVAFVLMIQSTAVLGITDGRTKPTGRAAANPADLVGAFADGPVNSTVTTSLFGSHTLAQTNGGGRRKLPVRRLYVNASVDGPGTRRRIRPQRVHHPGSAARAGRNIDSYPVDAASSSSSSSSSSSAIASNQRHRSKSILRGPQAKHQLQQQQQQRVYENVQRGSITLPIGSEAFLAPNDNRTLAFSSQSNPTIYRPAGGPPQRRRNTRLPHHGHRVKGGNAGVRRHGAQQQQKFIYIDGLCISCPPEKTAVAREGLDGVLIEPPVLATCSGRPISRDLYELETLFGPRINFALPHSHGAPYSFLANVVNKRTGNTVLTCDLRYRVVVKQCRRYKPKNHDLKVTCTLNSIWGSRCTFHCRSGGYLSRPNAFVKCGVNELWEGEEPYCTFNDVSDDYAADSDPGKMPTDCQLEIPSNGRIACDLQDADSASNELTIPNGTACQVKCVEGYYIPTHLQPAAYLSCVEGQWNNTMRDLCYKSTQTGGGSQRHRGYG